MQNSFQKFFSSKSFLEKKKKLILPFLAFFLVMSATLFLFDFARTQNLKSIDHEISNLAKLISNEFEIKFSDLLNAQIRIAKRWEARKGTPFPEFKADAMAYVEHHSEYQAIEWVDAEGVARWVVPLEGNEKALGWDNKKDAKRWSVLLKAKEQNQIAFSDAINLLQGGKGLLAFVPIVYDDTFDGYVLGVYRFQNLVEKIIFANSKIQASEFELSYNGKQAYYFPQTSSVDKKYEKVFSRKTHGQEWSFRLVPSHALVKSYKSYLPEAILLLGFACSLSIFFVIYFALHALEKKLLFENNFIELTRSNEELENFNYIASHDLQEPLRKIQGFASIFLSEGLHSLTHDDQKYIFKIMESSERMSELISDLLNYSLIHKKELEYQPVNLKDIFATVLENLELAIQESSAEVTLPQEMPQIEGNPSQLVQLFQNLVSNAIKYVAPNQKPKINISCQLLMKSNQLQIVVSDNGIGVDSENHKKVFKPFVRLHRRAEYKGSGIGLAICKRIVEKHNGTIDMYSELGKGTQFFVILPIKQKKKSSAIGAV